MEKENEKVQEILKDFKARAAARRAFEAQWQLNCNFVAGNQYVYAGTDGSVLTQERDYYWQERACFNHIAPIVETRLAKLQRVRPKMSVRPASSDEDDRLSAKAAGKILASACARAETDVLIARATTWSEICGSAFYKVVWNGNAGRKVGVRGGKDVYEGDVEIEVCPPFEIYPDSLAHQSVRDCESIIHARAVTVEQIERVYGVKAESERADLVSDAGKYVLSGLDGNSASPMFGRESTSGCCLLIERYTRPSAAHKEGEYVAVAGGKLLMCSALPYKCGDDLTPDLPFVKQDCLTRAGCFYGTSMVERCIPIQRAFNAVKNRKHEFMNRIAMGVLAVEDGSVDTDNLECEGLSPGKILVYRQGSNPPVLLDPGRVPSDFGYEEDRLLAEFVSVTGVSEIMRSSSVPSGMTSGTALRLLVEQDDTRLSVTAENVRAAVRCVARMLLRLYKQFARRPRLVRFVGEEGDVELVRFTASDIGCDDVVFETDNELTSTPAQRQSLLFDLLKMGLLSDADGKLSEPMRNKILDTVGYGNWESTREIANMQVANARRENMACERMPLAVSEIDDDDLHESEHVRFMLSHEFARLCERDESLREKMALHVREHRDGRERKREEKHGERTGE